MTQPSENQDESAKSLHADELFNSSTEKPSDMKQPSENQDESAKSLHAFELCNSSQSLASVGSGQRNMRKRISRILPRRSSVRKLGAGMKKIMASPIVAVRKVMGSGSSSSGMIRRRGGMAASAGRSFMNKTPTSPSKQSSLSNHGRIEEINEEEDCDTNGAPAMPPPPPPDDLGGSFLADMDDLKLRYGDGAHPVLGEQERRTSKRRSGLASSESGSSSSIIGFGNASRNSLGINAKEAEEMDRYVKSERIKEWVKMFRRSDPRYQILNFFNDVAQEGAAKIDQEFNPLMVSPLLRAFYRSSVFTVWRPTSYDAIRRMMLGEGVGKGLDIKGKSAKKGKLSGFVPFLQIYEEHHKKEIRTLPKDKRVRVFFPSKEMRDEVVENLKTISAEMVEAVQKARAIVDDESITDDDTNEAALQKLIWDMEDPEVKLLDDYAPKCFGMCVPERLLWEGMVIRQSIHREKGTDDDTGRPSEPNFQNMNFGALRNEPNPKTPRPVIQYYVDPNDRSPDPMSPLNLVMAYEEKGRVMPVVSDFDCFLVGTRGVKYKEAIPDDQFSVLMWCVDQIESILDGETKSSTWTSRWLDVLKHAASKGFHPKIPPLGFSDPKTNNIMKHAIRRLHKEGAVRHGAECFNFYFPQELDDEFLVLSDELSGQTLPWKYVGNEGLQEILKEKIDQGYTFPVNPKWILCDNGWKNVYDKLMASNAANVQDSLKVWYPLDSGIREKIETIHQRHPAGFTRGLGRSKSNRFEEVEGTAAMDLAELELKYYLTLQRAKRKLRGFLIWKGLLDDVRKRAALRRASRMLERQSMQGADNVILELSDGKVEEELAAKGEKEWEATQTTENTSQEMPGGKVEEQSQHTGSNEISKELDNGAVQNNARESKRHTRHDYKAGDKV